MCVVLKIINYFECLLVRIIQLARACACSTKNNNNKIKIIVFICVVVVVVLTNESRGINYAQIRRQTTQRNQPGFITWRSTNKLQNIFGRGGTPSWIEWMTPLVLFVKLELGFQVEIYIYIYSYINMFKLCAALSSLIDVLSLRTKMFVVMAIENCKIKMVSKTW